MMVKSTNKKNKSKIISPTCKKRKNSSTQLKRNTRTPIKKCQDRIKKCRQKIKTKQKCSRAKKREEESAKSPKSEDVNKTNTAKRTKVQDEKCSVYFELDLTEKEMRLVLKNFPDKFLLTMPGMKKNRAMEIQCKLAAYETKKRKILKLVSQEGLKNDEVERAARNFKKIREMKAEKSMKRKASQEAVIQENQVSENPVTLKDTKNEDFWKFIEPFSIPAKSRFPSRSYKSENQCPVVQDFMTKLQLAPTTFYNNCDKSPSSNMLPALESTLCSKENGALQFSKKRCLIDLRENEVNNHTLPFKLVSSTQLSAHEHYSSNPISETMIHFEPLKLENGKTTNNKMEMRNRNSVNYYCKIKEKEIENNLNKETNYYDSEAIKQNVPLLANGTSNEFANANSLEKILNTTRGIQLANLSVENTGCNKNRNSFKFSTPVYHNVDLTKSDSETTFDSLNYSEDIPPMDYGAISKYPLHLNYHIRKTYLDCDEFPEPFSSPNSFANIEILNHTQASETSLSKGSSEAVSVDSSSSCTNDSNTSNSSSRSASSELSSYDSCLETSSSSDEEEDFWSVSSENSPYNFRRDTSFSSDDEEHGKGSSPINYNTLQITGSNNDIYEKCSTNFLGQESNQASFRSLLESNLSQTASNNFSDKETRDSDTKRSSDNMTLQRKVAISFVNDSLHCLKQKSSMTENGYEQKEKTPTSNSKSKKFGCSSSRTKHEGKRNSKKMHAISESEI